MRLRYLFGIAVLCAVIAIIALRYNNQHVADLRSQILSKDQEDSAVTADLENLRRFVFRHMNTSTRVELVGSYNRAVAKTQTSGDLYATAQASCDRQGVSSVAQAQCVQAYLAERVQPAASAAIDKSRFIYVFAAPSWTPDIAGFALLGAVGFALTSLVIYLLRLFRNRPEAAL